MIDAIPGLKAARDNDSIVFLNLDTDDTNPVITAGFDDESIAKMDADRLRKELEAINIQEQNLSAMLDDCRKRRRDANAILARKTEIARNGIYN